MNFDPYTILFLALAAFILYKLRSVLGQKTGHEERPPEPPSQAEAPRQTGNDNVVSMRPAEDGASPTAEPAYRWQGSAEPGSPLADAYDAIAAADPAFDPAGFARGAKAAYEMIVNAFNSGDRKTLKNLLSRDVFDSFNQAIGERESRGESVQASFVSLDQAEIVEATLKDRVAQITVRFGSQVISAIRDKDGAVIDGSPDKIEDVTDQWSFARDTATTDPNWRVIGTD